MAAPLYPYLGTEVRFYSQYLDVTESQQPLTAEPGGSYAILPAPGYDVTDKSGNVTSNLPVPPADGRWGDPEKVKPNTVEATDSAPAKAQKGASA